MSLYKGKLFAGKLFDGVLFVAAQQTAVSSSGVRRLSLHEVYEAELKLHRSRLIEEASAYAKVAAANLIDSVIDQSTTTKRVARPSSTVVGIMASPEIDDDVAIVLATLLGAE